MSEEFENRPLGGFAGERLTGPPPAPSTPPPKPLLIEPPPWLEAGELDLTPPPASKPLGPPRLDDYDPPAPPGPPLALEPLLPVPIPAPNWREEERLRRERDARVQAAAAQDAYEPEPERWPARKRAS